NRGRSTDPNHVMGHGYAFSIASRIGAAFPDKNLRFFNRGISGNKITDLAQRWQTDTLALHPDVLSILVGVNDAASVINHKDSVSVAQYETIYTSLLEQTRQALPETLLVLGEPFILPNPKFQDKWADWQIDLQERQQVVQRLASTFNAVCVPYQKVFSEAVQRAPVEYWIWDGIHPTVAGHELMTREWLRQVRHRLHFLKRSL
ncbi:MAG TPA: SGNH/GDSL hydrolase family protein, partial [Hymenobacter sp.]